MGRTQWRRLFTSDLYKVRSQHCVVVRSTFTTIVTLLIEMAGTRHKPKKQEDLQKELFAATG